jgi:nicotinamide mononucleotide transporter
LVNIGHISNYSWGVLSAVTWFAVSLHNWLLSDIATQGFFLVMQFVGIYMWSKAIQQKKTTDDSDTTESKTITLAVAMASIAGTVVLYFILVFTTSHLNGNQVWLDATLLPLNIVGQILMSYSFREQWIAWILVNIINIVIWFNQSQAISGATISMLVLQVAMLINSFYGAYLWFKDED